jgi:ubiquinone/menaquinone biosynthesis C-methylase UbiE
VIYQHPLAYLLGLEGLALLHAFAGEYDEAFTSARLAECRDLLASSELVGEGASIPPITAVDGYRSWVPTYDDQANQLIELEQPIVWQILDLLPPGDAVDVACGTGRHTAHLASLGHTVIGIDSSAEMLDRAHSKVPGATFHQADLHDLPLDDGSADLLVCALALTHVPDLGRALAEFTRVLRPGGHLVLSDSRAFVGSAPSPLVGRGADGLPGYIPSWNRLTSDYLEAALPLGLQVLGCTEPRRPSPLMDPETPRPTSTAGPPGTPPDIWQLHDWSPAATNAAYRGQPAAIVWHFQLSPTG